MRADHYAAKAAAELVVVDRDLHAESAVGRRVSAELKLETNAHAAVSHLCSQANKALLAHTRERDAWRAEADRAQQESKKLKDRLEEMAYKVNGLTTAL